MNTIGEKLLYLRQMNNKKQKEVAEALHITPQAYSQYERDLRKPDAVKIRELAAYYNVSLDFLLGNQTESGNSIPLEKDLEKLVAQITALLLNSSDLKIGNVAATKEDVQSIVDGMNIGLELARKRK